ncbi:transporter substrate-binding domain-containing protein [Micropruina sp.]|uniref:transporter substrate-binding domain-containing protein n=1 Tax=Micropruina sp. TaxID=2737536 RepID=UPI0039E3A3E9
MSFRFKALRAAVAGVAALSLSMLAACANYSTPTTASPSGSAAAAPTLITPGKLLVCTHLSYKPFQFKDDSGNVVGFDVDLMDLVAKKLGVTQEIVDVPFDQITSGAAFAAHKCDAAAAATTIREDRAKAILFSDPYFEATQALLVKAGSGIASLADLKGKKLGVQTDTTGQDYAKANAEANGYEIVVFEDMPSQLAAVLSGRVDGAVNDNGVVFDYAKENPTSEVSAEFDTGEQYGLMAKRDDASGTALIAVINEVLKTSKTDGTYNDIFKKWFGVDAPK